LPSGDIAIIGLQQKLTEESSVIANRATVGAGPAGDRGLQTSAPMMPLPTATAMMPAATSHELARRRCDT
jgi:hypothetical protein